MSCSNISMNKLWFVSASHTNTLYRFHSDIGLLRPRMCTDSHWLKQVIRFPRQIASVHQILRYKGDADIVSTVSVRLNPPEAGSNSTEECTNSSVSTVPIEDASDSPSRESSGARAMDDELPHHTSFKVLTIHCVRLVYLHSRPSTENDY